MQKWYTTVTVRDLPTELFVITRKSKKGSFLCKLHEKGILQTFYEPFPQPNSLSAKNTLESRRFVTKKACFYHLFLSIADFFSCGEFSTKWTYSATVRYIHMIKWWLVLCLVAGEMLWRDQRSPSRVAMANDPFWDLRFFGSGESVWSEIANPFSKSLKTTHPEIDPNCTSGVIFIRCWIVKYCTLLFDRARGTEMYSSACPTCSTSFCPPASILISDWSLPSGWFHKKTRAGASFIQRWQLSLLSRLNGDYLTSSDVD